MAHKLHGTWRAHTTTCMIVAADTAPSGSAGVSVAQEAAGRPLHRPGRSAWCVYIYLTPIITHKMAYPREKGRAGEVYKASHRNVGPAVPVAHIIHINAITFYHFILHT